MVFIGIVDDKHYIRNMLYESLRKVPNYHIVFTAENGVDFLEAMKVARKIREPDIVLMDIEMPVMNGIDAIAQGKLRYTQTRYIVLSVFDDDDKIFEAIKAGADGYLLKDEPIERIKQAIDDLMRGECAPLSPGIARKVLNLLGNAEVKTEKNASVDSALLYNLTEREKEILHYLVDGFEYKEIASTLGLSPNTIRNMISKIYQKLHVSSRMQAAKIIRKDNPPK